MVKVGGVIIGILIFLGGIIALTQLTLDNSNTTDIVGIVYLCGTIISGFAVVVGISSTIKSARMSSDSDSDKS
jgi:hypothetical protein